MSRALYGRGFICRHGEIRYVDGVGVRPDVAVASAVSVGEGVDHDAMRAHRSWSRAVCSCDGVAARIDHRWCCWWCGISRALYSRGFICPHGEIRYVDGVGVRPDVAVASAVSVGEGVDHVAFAGQR